MSISCLYVPLEFAIILELFKKPLKCPTLSQAKWAREEALAQIGATLLVDLPPGNTVDVDPYTWTFSLGFLLFKILIFFL